MIWCVERGRLGDMSIYYGMVWLYGKIENNSHIINGEMENFIFP